MAVPVTARPVGRWIVSAGYDQLFLGLAWVLPFVLWAVAAWMPQGLLIALVTFVLLDNSHQVATLPLTVCDPVSRVRLGRAYLGGTLAIGGTAIALSLYPESWPTRFWASLVVYWGAYHIIRQHYGFLRLYQARDKPNSARRSRAEALALYAGAAFPYLLNLSHGWASEGIGAALVRIPVPMWSAWLVWATFATAFGFVLADAVRRTDRGTVRLLHVTLTVSNFWVGLLWVGRSDLLLAILFITSYHDLQYHAIVWRVGRQRAATASEPMWPAVRRAFGSVVGFALLVIGGGLLQAFLRNDFQIATSVLGAPHPWSAALFALVTSYSYMHYFFDGKMWKLSQDARLRMELGLARAPASPPPQRAHGPRQR